MAWTIIQIGGPYLSNSDYMKIQIDSANDLTATGFPNCAVGSEAYTADFSVIAVKKNDGTWQVNQ